MKRKTRHAIAIIIMTVPAEVFRARKEYSSAVLYASERVMSILQMQIVTRIITMLTMRVAGLILKSVHDSSFTRAFASKINLSYAFQGEGAVSKIC